VVAEMKNNKGLTLIELLIAAAIFTVVITLAGTMLVSGFKNYEQVSEIMTGQANTRYVMYEISKYLRNASISDITINESNTSITIDDVTISYSSVDSTVSRQQSGSLTVIARDISEFAVSLSGDTISYSIQSSDESSELNSSVTIKEFERPSPP
jgi:prepilin-type N-terminal cleavage/methylation domain-containing protein